MQRILSLVHNMDVTTKELRMQKGIPIETSFGLKIAPITIGQIVLIGYDYYRECLSILCAKKSDYENLDPNCDLSELDILKHNLIYSTEDIFSNKVYKAISTLLQSDIFLSENFDLYLEQDEKMFLINNSEFAEIKAILMDQNALNSSEDDSGIEGEMANSKADEIRKKILKGRAQLSKNKDEVLFSDLVDVLCAKGNGITPFNVWDLSYYMFNLQFRRMQMIEDFDLNIRYLIAGADSDKVKLRYYVTRKQNS